MSQAIECTSCHDLIDVTADSIQIPFVCNTCSCETCTGCEACEDISMEEVLGGTCVDETQPTVEELQAEINKLAEYVTDIEIQLQNTRQEKLSAEIYNQSLREDNQYITMQNSEVNRQLAEVRRDLKAALGIAERLA